MKKLLAMTLTLAMVVSMSTVALAYEDEATGSTDMTDASRQSSGESNVEVNDSGDFYYNADDDDAVGTADTEGGDIYVWGRSIVDDGAVYKLVIAWGAMEFTYSNDGRVWDPDTHTYSQSTDGEDIPTWEVDDLDGENNLLKITNHSNRAMEAEVSFALEDGVFNDGTYQGSDAVEGNFFHDNDDAVLAALLTNTSDAGYEVPDAVSEVYSTIAAEVDVATNVLEIASLYDSATEFDTTGDATTVYDQNLLWMHNASGYSDMYYDEEDDEEEPIEYVVTYVTGDELDHSGYGFSTSLYFAFSGEATETVNAFAKLGTITVTVAEMSVDNLQYFEYYNTENPLVDADGNDIEQTLVDAATLD